MAAVRSQVVVITQVFGKALLFFQRQHGHAVGAGDVCVQIAERRHQAPGGGGERVVGRQINRLQSIHLHWKRKRYSK